MKGRQESIDCECVSCDSISLFLTSLARNSQPLMGAHSKSTSRVKQEDEIELYVENILLQLPAWDKRSEKNCHRAKGTSNRQKAHWVFQRGMARLDPKASRFVQSILEFKRPDFLLKGPRLIIPSSIRYRKNNTAENPRNSLSYFHCFEPKHYGILKCFMRFAQPTSSLAS